MPRTNEVALDSFGISVVPRADSFSIRTSLNFERFFQRAYEGTRGESLAPASAARWEPRSLKINLSSYFWESEAPAEWGMAVFLARVSRIRKSESLCVIRFLRLSAALPRARPRRRPVGGWSKSSESIRAISRPPAPNGWSCQRASRRSTGQAELSSAGSG